MTTSVKLMRVEEFLELPEPEDGSYELHGGELSLMPPPKERHEWLQERLRDLFRNRLSGEWIVRVEKTFQPLPEYEVWRADVAVISSSRVLATPSDSYLQGAPDLVVEVLSPRNTAQEINDKVAVCLLGGCQSFWVVNDKLNEVHVTEGSITRRYSRVESIEFLGTVLSVSEIFI